MMPSLFQDLSFFSSSDKRIVVKASVACLEHPTTMLVRVATLASSWILYEVERRVMCDPLGMERDSTKPERFDWKLLMELLEIACRSQLLRECYRYP
jgi:hypothetical protein